MSPTARSTLVVLSATLALAACGGGGGGDAAPAPAPTPAPAPAPTGLSGKVAVGVVLQHALLRIVDADGTEIARDVAVGSDGSYAVPTVAGRAPYRLEACGYAGAEYTCIHSVATMLGTANVTPLTEATVLLATGTTPGALMSGTASALSADSVAAAQTQLRTGLASVLAGNVPAGFDFVAGTLDAGSRTGYDRVLDAVGVATGVDGSAFVQITPRVGSGNLYLQPGSSSGSVSVDAAAAALPLDGLDALFAQMTRAAASAGACGSGMAAAMSAQARLAFEGQAMSGAAAVGSGLCQLLQSQGLFGARFVEPTLGRCDTSGAAARCAIGFAIEATDGSRMAVSNGLGVVREGGAWKFAGSVHPLQIDASSRAQRTRRVDGATPVDHYERAIAIDIEAAAGLQCARVSQRNADGARVTIAYFKPYGAEVPRLSAWRGNDGERSLDPAAGELRSPDDTWLMLPEGATGDAVVRNFFRGGRTITIATYSDAACTTPLAFEGRSEFEVDVEGVPPVWASMPSLPWPELSAATLTQLTSFTLGAGASADFAAGWSFPNGRAAIGELSFCAEMTACGDGEIGRIGHRSVSPAASSASVALANRAPSAVGAWRMLSLYGAGPGRLGMQANFTSCRGTAEGQSC